MKFKGEQSQSNYYKKLGDKALSGKKFNSAGEHYLRAIKLYPFIPAVRNARLVLKNTDNPKLNDFLTNIELRKKDFLEVHADKFIKQINRLAEDKSKDELKSYFYKYPYTKHRDIVEKIQVALGEYLLKGDNKQVKSLFIDLGKYNPNSEKLKRFLDTMFDRLTNDANAGNAMFDLMEINRYFNKLIEDKLPEVAKQLNDIFNDSIEFNQKRFSIFTLGAISENNFDFIKNTLPEIYKYIDDPQSILDDIKKRVHVVGNSMFQIKMSVEVSNPHIWVLDACIDTIGSLAEKYPFELEYFIPVIIKRFREGNFYTKKKCFKALINFSNSGIDIEKYIPKKELNAFNNMLPSGEK